MGGKSISTLSYKQNWDKAIILNSLASTDRENAGCQFNLAVEARAI